MIALPTHHARTLKEEFSQRNTWLKNRLDTIIPYLLEREHIDMWIVIGRENNEDPVLLTMLPQEFFGARRRNVLIFLRDQNGETHRFSISRPLTEIDEYYTAVWYKGKGMNWARYYEYMATRGKTLDVDLDDYEEENEFECLARIVRTYDPQTIALNFSETHRYADGIKHSEYAAISTAIGEGYAQRITSAENLCLGWLERRLPEEIAYYESLVTFTQAIIRRAFSTEVIQPGVTTNTDVRFFMMQTGREHGAPPWFDALCWVYRQGHPNLPDDGVIIQPGDILHIDFGITYMGLNTDIQEIAYIARPEDSEVPAGIRKAHAQANQLQDFVVAEMILGTSGNDVLMNALEKAKAAGLTPAIYSHPIGVHGHAAGATFGRFDWQQPSKDGEYPVYPNTMYALELNVMAPIEEWDGQVVLYGLETDIVIREDGSVHYFGKRQTQPHFVK